MPSAPNKIAPSAPSHDIVAEVSATISGITGVQLGARQRVMVASRMQKRVSELGLQDLKAYAAYFATHRDAEVAVMVSLLTTHHTYFFREFAHFSYLTDKALAALGKAAKARGASKLKLWSAACSRGQEAYSLAMLLSEQMPLKAPGLDFSILGTDVDPESVAIARNGVYARREIKEIPHSLQNGHWASGTGDIADFVKAKASLKSHCRFAVGNLLSESIAEGEGPFDIIFCRNVFIYFTAEQVSAITNRLLNRLTPEGILFVGISESLQGLDLPIHVLGPSIYAKKSHAPVKSAAPSSRLPASAGATAPASPLSLVTPTAPEPARTLRVLCVDDSPSILSLLQRILSEEHGFRVVGTAANGLIAARELARLGKDVDLVTLDIHMPEQTGPEYLRANFRPGHPPVVMISSVNRDDTDLAVRCLESGASDYIEKPSLLNFVATSEEIRIKLRCAYQAGQKPAAPVRLTTDHAARETLRDPDACLVIAVAGIGDCGRLASYLRERTRPQPPLLVLAESAEALLPTFAAQLQAASGLEVQSNASGTLSPGSVQLTPAALAKLPPEATSRRLVVLLFTAPSPANADKLLTLSKAHILLESSLQSVVPAALMRRSDDIVPWTSFSYMSTAFLRTGGGPK